MSYCIGIDPHHVKDHQKYIDKLSSDFEQSMKEMIQAGIKEKSQKFSDPLLEEILQHVSFCNKKCESFHGRDTTLEVNSCGREMYRIFIKNSFYRYELVQHKY